MTAPDKIWLALDALHIGAWTGNETQRVDGDAEYISADIAQAQIAQAKAETATTQMREAAEVEAHDCDDEREAWKDRAISAELQETTLLAANETERQTLIRHNAAHAAQVADLTEKLVAMRWALRPFADIGIGSDPDYQPIIRMDRAAIVAARNAVKMAGASTLAKINWRDDPLAFVEDDEPMTERDYE